MRVSINVTNYSWPGELPGISTHLGRIARAADDAGVDTVFVADHLLQGDPTSTPEAEMLEAYTTLGFLAAQTTRVRLGTMVSAVTYREVALLVKAVTTLDVLTSGRAWFGIGAGYHQYEADAMGLALPAVTERFERLEETLRLAIQMWSGNDAAFNGKHYRLKRPINSPQSLQRPHPPILIGGTGELKTLRLVAMYADACNLFEIPDGGRTVSHKLGVLARHCAVVGRSLDDIEKTLSTRLVPDESSDDFVQRCAMLAALGIEHVVVILGSAWSEERIATLATAIPFLQQISC
jgi:F420-dependent oxidoreductase-like protein